MESKHIKEAPASSSPWGTFVKMFRDFFYLSFNNARVTNNGPSNTQVLSIPQDDSSCKRKCNQAYKQHTRLLIASKQYFLLTRTCYLQSDALFGIWYLSLSALRNVYMFFPDPSVWVSDSRQPFVKVQKEIPDVVYIKEGQDLVFPCRVTNPDTKVTLVKVSTFAMNSSKT